MNFNEPNGGADAENEIPTHMSQNRNAPVKFQGNYLK